MTSTRCPLFLQSALAANSDGERLQRRLPVAVQFTENYYNKPSASFREPLWQGERSFSEQDLPARQ